MAGSPAFKVHNPSGEYVAACKHVEDAAALVANYGDGARIKHRGRIVWFEGEAHDGKAGESFDLVARHVHAAIEQRAIDYRENALAVARAVREIAEARTVI